MERFPSFDSKNVLGKIEAQSINKGGIYEDMPRESYVDNGQDSIVYKFPELGLVAKFYVNANWLNDSEAFGKLNNYRNITNMASTMATREDWRVDAGILKNIPLRINEYGGLVYSDKYKCWVGLSPLVKGICVYNDEGRKYFKSGDDYSKCLRRIDDLVNTNLNITGVEMDLVNLKLVQMEGSSNFCVIVTDLCLAINDLKV